MSRTPKTTIEQWLTLRAVVEFGGFAQAAERLNRSQSSVSYAVRRLQERLGISLLRIEGRKAQLTDAGRVMLADAVPLIDELTQLEERTTALSMGYQARIRLLVDSLFPKRRLFDALAQFQAIYPDVQVDLRENVRQGLPVPEIEPHDLAITFSTPDLAVAQLICRIEMVAVSSPQHPLQTDIKSISINQLNRHTAVVIDGQAKPAAPAGAGRQWRLNNLESAVEAVRSGLCFGWLPRHLIGAHLASGELCVLPLKGDGVRWVPLTLVYADRDHASPVTETMASLLLSEPVADAQLRRIA